jgi:DNA mismatch endonuclease (patch repair protein)
MTKRQQPEARIQIPRFTHFKPSSEAASRAKRRNRSRDTAPELLLRRNLWRLGLRYRKNATDLPGKPDIIFRRARVVVFCDGDFWHGRNWKRLQEKLKAAANSAYWLPKIARNRQRDVEQTAALKGQGWLVIRLWEGDVKRDPSSAARRVADVVRIRLQALGEE